MNLNNVFFSPDIYKNLISVSSLAKQKYKIVFTSINDKSSALIYTIPVPEYAKLIPIILLPSEFGLQNTVMKINHT